MISHRRSLRSGLFWSVALAAVLVVASATQLGAAASIARAYSSAPTSTRIEGLINSISGNTWLVDQTTVQIEATTTIVQKGGAATVGAWVTVWGTQWPDHLSAEIIHVLRPAGAATPVIEFSGVLRKHSSSYLVVDDTLVTVTSETTFSGDATIGSLLSVIARRVGLDLVATDIAVIAADPASQPRAVEGTLEQVTDSNWVVDGHTISIPPGTNPAAKPGDRVEVGLVAANDGAWVAQATRIIDRSISVSLDSYVSSVTGLGEDNQSWQVLVFDASGAQQTQTVLVSAETYVDEDLATIQPDVEALIDGNRLTTTSLKADLIRLEQPAPAQVVGVLTTPGQDGIWHIGGRPVWFESETLTAKATAAQASAQIDAGGLVVARGVQLRNGVFIAREVVTGNAAMLTAGENVDATPWSSPTTIVPNLGRATQPTFLLGYNGTAHVIYESAGVIYHVMQPAGGSWGATSKVATGTSPVAAFDGRGRLNIVYVNEFLGNFDIYHTRFDQGVWTLPVNASVTTGRSADPAIATDATGKVLIAWMDLSSGQWTVHIGQWSGGFWTNYPVANARGQSPALTVLPDGNLFLAWQARKPTVSDPWGLYDIYASERSGGVWNLPINVSDNTTYSPGANSLGVALAATADGMMHLAWIDDQQQVRYNPGRGNYWPAPVNVGARRTLAQGLAMRLSQDGLLNLAWDEGTSVPIVSAPPMTQTWPAAESLPLSPGEPHDVALTAAAGGLAVTWVQTTTTGEVGLFESRHNMLPLMPRAWLPLVKAP